MINGALESLVQKVHSGVVIHFEKFGPDPPPSTEGKHGMIHQPLPKPAGCTSSWKHSSKLSQVWGNVEARCMCVHWSRTCDRRPLLVLSFRGGPLTLAAQSARGLPMVIREHIDGGLTGHWPLFYRAGCLVKKTCLFSYSRFLLHAGKLSRNLCSNMSRFCFYLCFLLQWKLWVCVMISLLSSL